MQCSLIKKTYDQFQLSKDEYSLLKEKEDTTDKTNKSSKEKSDTALAKKIKEPFKMDLTDLDTRRIRLTPASVNLSSYEISPKGDQLYFTASFDKSYELWQVDTRTHEMKSLAKLGAGYASLGISKDGKTLYVLSSGKLSKVNTADGKITAINIDGEMLVDGAAEREYIFNHAWRQVKKKLIYPDMHGVDWEMYKKTYAKFLPFIADNYDFRELLSEMLGELNVSHTGGRYIPKDENGDETSSLGLLYDEREGGKGLKIAEVISGGPLDKAQSKIRADEVILKIDGNEIDNSSDWAIF